MLKVGGITYMNAQTAKERDQILQQTLRERLDEVSGTAAARVNNVLLDRNRSRRNKCFYHDCDVRSRYSRMRLRLQKKLAAKRKENEREATEDHAEEPRQGPRQAQGKPREEAKRSSSPKKVEAPKAKKKCRADERK